MSRPPYLSKLSRYITGFLSKVLHGFLLSLGIMLGIWAVFAFQTAPTTPSTSGVGTGTADTKNESLTAPMLTQFGGTYSRTTMSLQAIATQAKLAADSASSMSANAGLYSNQIFSGTLAVAYTEVCFKGGTRTQDYHSTGGQSTVGGNCSPGDTGYVIETVARTAATWTNAKAICLTLGMRLPEIFEIQYTCNNTGVFGTAASNAVEWASNTAFDAYEYGASYPDVIVAHIFYFSASCSGAGYPAWARVQDNYFGPASNQYRCVR